MSFNDGTELGISAEELGQTEQPFIPSIALGMLPPRIPAIASAEWVWRPEGWPEDMALPKEGMGEVEHALNEWMSSRILDGAIAEICRRRILSSINEGFLSRNIWFSEDDREGFLESLEGSEIEREALTIILDSLEEGVYVKEDGTFESLEERVVRVDEAACHPILVTLWKEHGMHLLGEMFGIDEDEASEIHAKQAKRKQGFGAFLRQLRESRGVDDRLRILPWERDSLPSPLSFADRLIRDSFRSGVSSTVSSTSKQKGLLQAMGWAWLVVHNKTESDSWRFDGDSKDKGGDWVPFLSRLYDEGIDLLEGNKSSTEGYKNAMMDLASACGVSIDST